MTESIFVQVAKEAIRQGQPMLARDILHLAKDRDLTKQRIMDGQQQTVSDKRQKPISDMRGIYFDEPIKAVIP